MEIKQKTFFRDTSSWYFKKYLSTQIQFEHEKIASYSHNSEMWKEDCSICVMLRGKIIGHLKMRTRKGTLIVSGCVVAAESLSIFIWFSTDGSSSGRAHTTNFGFDSFHGLWRSDWLLSVNPRKLQWSGVNLCNVWSIAINLAFVIQGHYFDPSSVPWNHNEAIDERSCQLVHSWSLRKKSAQNSFLHPSRKQAIKLCISDGRWCFNA